jgi:DNA-binding MarR family transcriptional regulator
MANETGSRTQPALRRHFTYRLNVLSKLNDMMSQELYLAGSGLSLPEARCLAAIGSQPGQLTVMQLAFEANLDKAQVSRTTKLLVERGLVSKLPCPEDGRCVQLTLTAQGRSCCEQVMPLIQQRNQALLQCLSESEQASLLEMFDRMLEQARQQIRSDRPGD